MIQGPNYKYDQLLMRMICQEIKARALWDAEEREILYRYEWLVVVELPSNRVDFNHILQSCKKEIADCHGLYMGTMGFFLFNDRRFTMKFKLTWGGRIIPLEEHNRNG